MSVIWITTSQAAEISGYHPEHLRRLIRAKAIEAQKFGIVWQINKQSLIDYLSQAENIDDQRWGPKP